MTRNFTGGRDSTRGMSDAVRLKKLEIMKGGKLPLSSADRYKRILKKKMEEAKQSAGASAPAFQLPGAQPSKRVMSKKTEEAMRLIAMRKAQKEENELRKMVVVRPGNLSDAGRIDGKGNVYDVANNLVLKVNTKDGRIKTMSGWSVGKYKTKAMMRTNMLLVDSLKKHSPYFIKMRQMQILEEQQRQDAAMRALMAQHGMYGPAGELMAMNLYGYNNTDMYGNVHPDHAHEPHRTGPGGTAWGAMSDNVHGTFSNNAWGTTGDNVWGTMSVDVWGGVGSGSVWGKKGMRIWGSGSPNQKNYLRPLWVFLITALGFKGRRHSRGHGGQRGGQRGGRR